MCRIVRVAGEVGVALQGCIAHKKPPPPLGPPEGPRHKLTVECWGGAVSYERGTPIGVSPVVHVETRVQENLPTLIWHKYSLIGLRKLTPTQNREPHHFNQ